MTEIKQNEMLSDNRLEKEEKYKEAVRLTREKVTIREFINFDKEPEEPVKVSIVVPVCNVEQYLRECLDSCVNQTLREIEIICVNDGSTDHSLDILKEYAAVDERVKIIDKENAGYGHTMNIGIDMAKGEYIGIVESDDFVELSMYSELYKTAKENDVDFVKADFNRFVKDENGNLIKKYNRVVKDKNKYYQVLNPSENLDLMMGVMNTWSGIYSREFMKRYNIRHNETPGASYQDNGFFFQTFCCAKRTYFINKAFYLNRRDNPNSSVYNTKKAFCMKEEYEFVKDFLKTDEQLWDRFKHIYCIRKFQNYRFSYVKADNESKKKFLNVFYDEFNVHIQNHDCEIDDFTGSDKEELLFLLKSPKEYYRETCDENVKISVIIPAYNESQNIKQCLDSVCEQTLRSIEIICIDDGSTDDTVEILKQYASNDDRIVILRQENQGAGVARNYGLHAARGEFVCFLDADDWYPAPSVLRNLLIAAKNNNAKICGGSFSNYRNGKINTVFEGILSNYTFTEHKMMLFSDYQFDYGYHRFIYDLELLKENEITFPKYLRYQDPVFFVKTMLAAKRFYTISQVVYVYRKNDKKLKWTKEKVYDLLSALKENLEIAKENELDEMVYNTVMRINVDFVDVIVKFASQKENLDLFLLLVDIQKAIDTQKIGERLNDKTFIIKPLYRISFGSGKKADDLKSNVNKKTAEELTEKVKFLTERLDRVSKLESDVYELKKRIQNNNTLEKELLLTRASFTYKIGRAITWLPRKIRELFTHKD